LSLLPAFAVVAGRKPQAVQGRANSQREKSQQMLSENTQDVLFWFLVSGF